MRKLYAAAAAAVAAVSFGTAACGDGEDRPGQVTSESDSRTATGTGSASATGTGTASGSATGGGHDHGKSATEAQFDAGEETSKVDLELRDYTFVGVPAETSGPNVLFMAEVVQGEHELEVLDDDEKSIGEIPPFKSGTKQLALVLQPGTYTLQCLVEEGEKTHADLGMKAKLTVT